MLRKRTLPKKLRSAQRYTSAVCVCVCVSGVWRENKKNTSAHTVKKRLNRCEVVIQSALKSVGFGYHLPPGRRKAV